MKNIFKINTKPGSALLMSLFIMATVGVVSFGSTRLYITELRSTSNLTNTPQAFYAAESALENGLLAYKVNPQVQWYKNCIPDSSGDNTPGSCHSSDPPDFVELPKLDNGEKSFISMTYWGDLLSDKTVLRKDNSATISVDLSSDKTLSIYWAHLGDKDSDGNPLQSCGNSNDPNKGVRVAYISSDKLDVNRSRGDIFHPYSYTSPDPQKITLTSASAGVDTVVIRPIGCDIKSYTMSDVNNNAMDSGVTTIDGLGKYNDISRQLEAKVDRSTGQLNGIFNYTLYGKDSIESPVR